jgi:hypothetical protein
LQLQLQLQQQPLHPRQQSSTNQNWPVSHLSSSATSAVGAGGGAMRKLDFGSLYGSCSADRFDRTLPPRAG